MFTKIRINHIAALKLHYSQEEFKFREYGLRFWSIPDKKEGINKQIIDKGMKTELRNRYIDIKYRSDKRKQNKTN